MHLYPEHDTSGKPPTISEIWHGNRWQSLPSHYLPPMIVHPETHEHFYVGEMCETKSGERIIPERWLSEKTTGKLLVKARRVENNQGVSVFEAQNEERERRLLIVFWQQEQSDIYEVSFLRYSLTELITRRSIPHGWLREKLPMTQYHQDRILGIDTPLYVSYIEIFGDDFSGNRSKQWNKHENQYLSHRNLPRTMESLQAHVHFLSSSACWTINQQFGCLKSIIK